MTKDLGAQVRDLRFHWQAGPLLVLLGIGLWLSPKPTLVIAGLFILLTVIGLYFRVKQIRKYGR